MKHYKQYGIILLGPVVIGVGILYFMIIWNLIASLTQWNLMQPTWNFIGLQNYIDLIAQKRFWINVGNNLLWLTVFILPTTIVGFVLAYLLSSLGHYEKIFRQIFLYPMALSFVITGVLWSWMYDPSSGLLNSIINGFLNKIGLDSLKIGWIVDPKMAIYCLIFTGFWQFLGFSLVIFTGAIRGLPESFIEAAQLEGCNRFQILFRVIFPNVSHATLICTTMLGITSMKVFDLVWVMTGGGPGVKTEVLPFLMYKLSFANYQVGLGAATSMIILLIAAAFVIPYSLWAMKRWF